MILSSVIIVLGEVLEAAILASIFLALTYHFRQSKRWLLSSLTAGVCFAALYAFSFDHISLWFDGFGQEIINAFFLTALFLCLALFNVLIFSAVRHAALRKPLRWMMALSVCLAITREGSEIYLYLSGYYFSEAGITPVLTGSILGFGIGISVGTLIYYLLVNVSPRFTLNIGFGLILFSAAGMLSQTVRLLIQIDWLPSQDVLWDSSWLISESSVTGRLLYSLIGYEATPTSLEAGFYFSAVVLIFVCHKLVTHSFHSPHHGDEHETTR